MIFKFRILSGEVSDFIREIEMKSNQTFFDLHKAIQLSVGWDESQMASFFLSNNSWEKGTEITLIEMFDDEFSETIVMDVALLSEFIKEKKQKLLYVYDLFTERFFYIEMVQIYKNGEKEYPICVKTDGEPPIQVLLDDSITNLPSETDYYGSDDDIDDLGFENIDDYDL